MLHEPVHDARLAGLELATEDGAEALPPEVKRLVLEVLLPVRHFDWGANMNNTFISAYGYGTAIEAACMYAAMDRLGLAQQTTRVGLAVGGEAALDTAKVAWLQAPQWQPLRKYVEDTLVVKDWFELFVAQNLVVDALVFDLLYGHVAKAAGATGSAFYGLVTRFMRDWQAETTRWVDAVVKAAAADSPRNATLIKGWLARYTPAALAAVEAIARPALGDHAPAALQGALQTTEESRPIIDAILADNPGAVAIANPGMVGIDADGRLTIRRATVEERVGRRFDLQELHVHLITLSDPGDHPMDMKTEKKLSLKDRYRHLTRGLGWDTTYQPMNEVFPYDRYEGITIHDWDRWEDPFRLTMDAYWKYQAEKERKLYAILDAFNQSNGHLNVTDARYFSAIKLFFSGIPLLEYMAHRGFSMAGRNFRGVGPRVACQMQSLDEIRHAQTQIHTASNYNRYYNGMHAFVHQLPRMWYMSVPKSFFDDAITAGPFEWMIAIGFSFEYVLTNLFFVPFMSGAASMVTSAR